MERRTVQLAILYSAVAAAVLVAIVLWMGYVGAVPLIAAVFVGILFGWPLAMVVARRRGLKPPSQARARGDIPDQAP